MKQQSEDEKIRELFQQQRREDERGVRSFAEAWSAALSNQGSRQGKSRRGWIVWRFAAVTAVLAVLGAGWWMYSRPSTKLRAPVEMARSDGPVDTSFPPQAILISQWRSPTESLLHAPGEQLFKSVPRVDESVVNIEGILPDPKEAI